MSENETKTPHGIGAALYDYVEMFVFAVVFVILILTVFLRHCEVDGPSMNQTLSNGDRLIVSDLFYRPQSGDIVVFHQTNGVKDPTSPLDRFNEPIVKRVIATGGQYVKIDYEAKKIYVSEDEIFEESELFDDANAWFSGGIWERRNAATIFHVPEHHLFVLGDNRNNSSDSRFTQIGFVDERRVLGKVLFRFSPFSSFGKID